MLQVSHHFDDSMRGISDCKMLIIKKTWYTNVPLALFANIRLGLDDKRASTFQSLPPPFFASNSLTGNNERKFFYILIAAKMLFDKKLSRRKFLLFAAKKKCFLCLNFMARKERWLPCNKNWFQVQSWISFSVGADLHFWEISYSVF